MGWDKLFASSEYNNLEPYLQAMRDFLLYAPIPDRALMNLQEIGSLANRFHVSGNKESISDVLDRIAQEDDVRAAAMETIFDGCNNMLIDEGSLKPLNIHGEGTAALLQSLAESIQEGARKRILKQY